MLYWICPECGHECSPAIRECPTCTAPPESAAHASTVQQRAGVSQELLSLSESFQSSSSVGLLSPAVAVAVEEPVKSAPPAEPELSQNLASLDGLTLQPARPRRAELRKPVAAPIPARISSPAVAGTAASARKEFGFQLAGPTPAGEISFQAAPGGQPQLMEEPAQPLLSRRQSVAFVRAELPVMDHSGMALADLAPLDRVPFKPVVPGRNGQPKQGVAAPLDCPAGEPSVLPSQLKVTGDSLADLLNALKVSAHELDQAGVDAIQASFLEQPAVGLLAAPEEIVMAPAPPAAQWLLSQKPKFTPIAPEHAGRATVTAGPQAPTLAGPSLPPQLVNFEPKSSSLRRNRKRISTWPISLLVATILILGAGSLLQYVMQDRGDTKAATVAVPAQTIKAAPALHTRVVEEHPAARSVEVAGVRIVTGPNKKPQLQYVVVNHSASEIMGLNIHLTVRSEEEAGDAPLCTASSIVASLGPNQSKEIHADVNLSVTPSAMPDWHSLRTEVLITRP